MLRENSNRKTLGANENGFGNSPRQIGNLGSPTMLLLDNKPNKEYFPAAVTPITDNISRDVTRKDLMQKTNSLVDRLHSSDNFLKSLEVSAVDRKQTNTSMETCKGSNGVHTTGGTIDLDDLPSMYDGVSQEKSAEKSNSLSLFKNDTLSNMIDYVSGTAPQTNNGKPPRSPRKLEDSRNTAESLNKPQSYFHEYLSFGRDMDQTLLEQNNILERLNTIDFYPSLTDTLQKEGGNKPPLIGTSTLDHVFGDGDEPDAEVKQNRHDSVDLQPIIEDAELMSGAKKHSKDLEPPLKRAKLKND